MECAPQHLGILPHAVATLSMPSGSSADKYTAAPQEAACGLVGGGLQGWFEIHSRPFAILNSDGRQPIRLEA